MGRMRWFLFSLLLLAGTAHADPALLHDELPISPFFTVNIGWEQGVL
jgi:hypothetical protein